MDSPHFTLLCFLLLTVAAPHPNIAMPSDSSAEGTQDFSSGETKVTVYQCKDCKSNVCASSNYEYFLKIGETQSKTFSNEIIQMATSETYIIMCFRQENTIPEGVFAIVWENDKGVGDSCGTPSSGVSSENVRGSIIKICCEAEVDPSVPNSTLKCYAEMPGAKIRKPPTNVTDEGNPDTPQFSGKNRTIGIVTSLLVLLVFAVLLTIYCVRRQRSGQRPIIVLRQTFNEAVEQSKSPSDLENGTPLGETCTNEKTRHLCQRTPQ